MKKRQPVNPLPPQRLYARVPPDLHDLVSADAAMHRTSVAFVVTRMLRVAYALRATSHTHHHLADLLRAVPWVLTAAALKDGTVQAFTETVDPRANAAVEDVAHLMGFRTREITTTGITVITLEEDPCEPAK